MEKKFLNITQLSNLLNLSSNKSGKPANHVLRYWEKEFKQIRPVFLKKRRYYSPKQVDLIKLIKFLIKDKGITLNGVKNILKSNINTLDDYNSNSLKADYYKKEIKFKSKKILSKLKKLKQYGQKISHKS